MKSVAASCKVAAGLAVACLWLSSAAFAQSQTDPTKNAHPVFPPSEHAQAGANAGRGAPPAALVEELKKAPTPQMAGHPDLTGFWGSAGWGYGVQYGNFSKQETAYDIENPVGTAERPAAVAAAKA